MAQDGYISDDELGALEDIGAIPRSMQRLLTRYHGGRTAIARPARVAFNLPRASIVRASPPIVQAVPGLSPTSKKYVPFGLGFGTMGVGVTTLQLTAQPQVPLKVRKLTVGVGRVGAGVLNALVVITAFNIGTVNQFAGLSNVDTAMYIANAEGATMDLSAAGPGINITLDFLSNIAPIVTESISVSASFLAQTVQP